MVGFILGQIPRNFKTSLFNLNLPFFKGKSQKFKRGRIPRFLRIHSIYNFRYFPENGHSDNGYFVEKFKIYIGWIRKNPGVHPVIILKIIGIELSLIKLQIRFDCILNYWVAWYLYNDSQGKLIGALD